jgi:hypothetical protein
MQMVLDTLESQDGLIQWWHDVGALALRLPENVRPLWLAVISEVVRHFRSYARCTHPAERRHYRSLCELSLSHVHAELFALRSEGLLDQPQLEHLNQLQKTLKALIEN